MHKIYSKTKVSREQEKIRLSGSFSKHQSSSDSSFKQCFDQLLRESDSLKRRMEEIVRLRLTPNDPQYSEFVERIVAKNKERQQLIFSKSMPPAQRKREDLLETTFTAHRIVEHIENTKRQWLSENVYRPFHSDMSRSRFLSNSVRELNPSIISPNFSGTLHGGMGAHPLFHRHEKKRRLHRYLSFSNGVTYHAKSAQGSVLQP